MKNKMSFTIKGGYVRTKMDSEDLQNHLRERKRGCGRHKSKRDYSRKKKHKGGDCMKQN